ncbi:MAG TPA: plasma-membrane proton-efflux P-type ATPase [Candidatus Nanoarchaeia archaeon]|nr:plasma-membrane proton-efflux P-type ATPase [Candidatus Nanoarchaeia archaeon]
MLKQLQTDSVTGLTAVEAKRRMIKYGRNEVAEKQQNMIVGFLKRFWGLTAWMLEIAIILSFVLGKYLDLYIITALLLVNAILGFAQELQATRAVKALKQKLQLQARILRDKTWATINAVEIVPGDIIRIRSGDFVPADLRIIDTETTVDQSAITGESLPLEKKPGDVIYSGSIIRKGEATGVIVATGANTYFGKTTELVQLAKPKLHMEDVISRLMKWLLVLVVSMLILASIVSWLRGLNLLDILPLALVLLVSAIPVALPTMFTITMALGSFELAKKGVLVTRLSASEDAALMDVLCIDKTGTITQNKLSVAEVLEMNNYKKEDVLLFGSLASQKANQDPIDLAFFAAVDEKNLETDGFVQKKFVPFDPTSRRTEAIIERQGVILRVVKGATSVILQMCSTKDEELRTINSKIETLSSHGYRVIAVATGDETKMDIVGLVALYDKPRPDSARMITKLKSLGISVKMLTGDSLPIAKQIAQEIDLGEKITHAADIEETAGKDALGAAEIVEASDGFAEIYPEGKYRIVRALQAEKHVVGMTGDGINDAAALKQAEIGIAVSNATDVAKGSASVVLTQEGLSNIIDLVGTGRMIYQRILTWIFNKIVKTFQTVLFVILAFLFTGLYVVDAFQVVLLLFLVDFVTISLSTDNVRPSEKPETWNITSLVKVSTVLGVVTVAESLGLLYIGLNYLGLSNTALLHTFAFDMLLSGGLFTIFIVRERDNFWKSKPSKPLLIAILADIIISSVISAIGIPGLTPIPIQYVGLALVWFFIFGLLLNDQIKTRLLPHLASTEKSM